MSADTRTEAAEQINDRLLELARQSQPELWGLIDGIARIVDPGAFPSDYALTSSEAAQRFEQRTRYAQAAAMSKAHDILRHLGIPAETDWLDILERLGRDDAERPKGTAVR